MTEKAINLMALQAGTGVTARVMLSDNFDDDVKRLFNKI